MNIGELTKQYVFLRSKKAKMDDIAKDRIGVVKKQLAEIEMKLAAFFKKTGQTSAKTEYGTPYKKLKISFNIDNSDAFFDYVIKNNAVDLLPKRVNSQTAKSYMDEGIKIPGVKIYSEEVINVKKS